jgi:hypothetical protein
LNIVTFELKRGFNRISIQDLLDKPNGPNQMRDFIEQAKRSASLAGTPFWILVLKRDLREELVVTNMAGSYDASCCCLMRYEGCDGLVLARTGSEFWSDDRRKALQDSVKKYENPA